MAEKPVQLSNLSTKELKELASHAGVLTDQLKKREELMSTLQSMPDIVDLYNSWEESLPRLLDSKSLKDLKGIAARHGVDASNAKKRRDVINLLVTHSSAPAITESLKAQKKLDEIKGELEEVKEEIEDTTHEAISPALEDLANDPIFKAAISLEIDFDHCEDLLDQARMRFEERNFEGALTAAVEAREHAEKSRTDFEKAIMAYAILSAHRLIEECSKAGRNVEKAKEILRRTERLYREEEFHGRDDMLREMEAVSRSLFSAEVQKTRDQIHDAQEKIHEVANLGADVRLAEEALNTAKDTLRRSEYQASSMHAARAVDLAKKAKKDRVRMIEETIPATVLIIEEAKHVGADVAEAERLVTKAKTAISSKDFLLASELIKRAERAAMEIQQSQILKAMELRRRQVEKAQEIITQVEPVIEEAASFGIDVTETQTLLEQAKEILSEGDYVNGTLFARNAAEAAKKLEPKLVEERIKRGITKPTEGVCASCGSRNLEFTDDGWSACKDCGYNFRWRAPGGVWSRFKSMLKG